MSALPGAAAAAAALACCGSASAGGTGGGGTHTSFEHQGEEEYKSFRDFEQTKTTKAAKK